jgi:branched-chain amino acid transport system substrate-binding protein
MFEKKWFVTLLAVATVAMCGGAGAQEAIHLGWAGPLSPPGNFSSGQESKWAVELKVEQINKAGGVLGRPLEVFFEDTKGQPEQGSAAALRLITDKKVSAIFGEYHTSVALAEIEVAHRYGVPWLAAAPWGDDITARQYDEVFRISPANSLVYTEVANWVAEEGLQPVAIVAENTDFGQEGAKISSAIFKEKGIDHQLVTVDLQQQDFTPVLARLMAQNPRPRLLQMVVAGQAQYALVKQACQLGFAPTNETAMLGSLGLLQPEFWELVGDCGKGSLVVSVGVPESQWTDATRSFISAFEARYGRMPTVTAMTSYDALGLLVAAIEKAGSSDPKAIVAALENITYEGILQTYSFSTKRDPSWAYHQFMEAAVLVLQYSDVGQSAANAAILYPKKWATGSLDTSAK